jgi:hypothetical protein
VLVGWWKALYRLRRLKQINGQYRSSQTVIMSCAFVEIWKGVDRVSVVCCAVHSCAVGVTVHGAELLSYRMVVSCIVTVT